MRSISAWDEEFTHDESLSIIKDLALLHLCRVTCKERRDYIAALVVRDDYSTLCNFSVDYTDPSWSTSDIINVRQALAFYQKFESLDIGVNKKEAAWSTFQEAESKCSETNIIFDQWQRGEFRFSPRVESVFYRAQRKIASVLGDVPALEELAFRFGPGATAGISRRKASWKAKLSAPPSCSHELLPHVDRVLAAMPMYSTAHAHSFTWDNELDRYKQVVSVDVHYGKIAFVPKSPKTYRTIGIEPLLNSMGQLAIGDILVQKLARAGVNLRDQTLNQRLAREGSVSNALATLDLSSASDTISRGLVWHLLPGDWASLLAKFRTSRYVTKDGILKLEKFSSMGNGYTFPLESLIFWALVRACCGDGETVSIYGDDIICPTTKVPLVIEVLTAAGFSVNRNKSYWSGPFRESCGSDYFFGIDIRPVYLKKEISGCDLFRLHNFYIRKLDNEMAEKILSYIPEHLRIYGPDGFGDGHLLRDGTTRPHNRSRGWSGYVFETFTKKNRRDSFRRLPGDLLLPFYSTYVRSGGVELEGDYITRYSTNRVCVDVSATPHDKGNPSGSLPGTRGYKRISIYTLNIS